MKNALSHCLILLLTLSMSNRMYSQDIQDYNTIRTLPFKELNDAQKALYKLGLAEEISKNENFKKQEEQFQKMVGILTAKRSKTDSVELKNHQKQYLYFSLKVFAYFPQLKILDKSVAKEILKDAGKKTRHRSQKASV